MVDHDPVSKQPNSRMALNDVYSTKDACACMRLLIDTVVIDEPGFIYDVPDFSNSGGRSRHAYVSVQRSQRIEKKVQIGFTGLKCDPAVSGQRCRLEVYRSQLNAMISDLERRAQYSADTTTVGDDVDAETELVLRADQAFIARFGTRTNSELEATIEWIRNLLCRYEECIAPEHGMNE